MINNGSFYRFWLLVLTCVFSFQTIVAQKVSLNYQNALLETVLNDIKQQTKLSLVFSEQLVDVDMKVNINLVDVDVQEAMQSLLGSTDIDFEIKNDKLYLVARKVEQKNATTEPKQTIYGVVRDTYGEPIIGASVMIKNSAIGTITDIDGNFSILASKGEELTVSYIGFTTQTIRVDKTNFALTLIEDTKQLEEVVVVGYGTQKKVNLTGAVSQIGSKEIEDRPVANMSQLLQGQVPNMNVSFSSGRPGSTGSFNIRGGTSINGGSPLILVDGVETSLDRINPRDVESVSVLKDASASAVYGARASFGVILVTTKSGTEKKTTISYGNKFGRSASTASTDFETRGYYSALINDLFFESYAGQPYTKYTADDYEQLWLRVNDKTEHPDRPWVMIDQRDGRDSYVYYGNTDWYNYFFDNARPMQEHSININGGSEKIKYLISGNIFEQDGVFKINPDKFRSMNFRTKLTAQIRPWLEISNNTKYFTSDYKFPGYGSVNNFFNTINVHGLASFVPVNPDGSPVYLTSITDYQLMDGWSALMVNNKHNNYDKYYEFGTTFGAVIKLAKGLNLRADFNYINLNSQVMNRSMNIPYSKYPGVVANLETGIGQDRLYEKLTTHWYTASNVYADYEKQFNQVHNFKVMAGVNYETKELKDVKASRQDLLTTELNDFNLAIGDVMVIEGGQNEYKILGSFYRINYDYNGKYLFETNGRLDGSSRFMRGHRFGFFPSASAAWRLSEESFFDDLRLHVPNVKIRASYGTLGNQQVGYYDYIQTVNTGGLMNYAFGDGQKASNATVSSPNASDLSWEVVTTKNLGLDFSVFKGRLEFTGDIYTRATKGMLTAGKDLPSVYGAGIPKMNAADLRTDGWEISLSWVDKFTMKNKPFSYGARFILSDYTSRITKFDNPSKLLSNYYEGQVLGEIWGYVLDGYFTSDEEAAAYNVDQTAVNEIINTSAGAEKGLKAGDIKFVDLDGDFMITPARTVDDTGDQIIVGNSNPSYAYGLNLSADWYGFDLSVFLQGIGKQNWYPGNNANLFWGPYTRPYATFIGTDFMSRVWSEENPDAFFPRPRGYIALKGNRSLGAPSDKYLQDLAYLRLKSLNFGYSLPTSLLSKVQIEKLRIYFSGENLLTFTKLNSKYIDPEQAAAHNDAKTYGWAKTFSIGLDLTF